VLQFFFESNLSHVPTIKKLEMSNHHFKVVENNFFTIRYTYKESIDKQHFKKTFHTCFYALLMGMHKISYSKTK